MRGFAGIIAVGALGIVAAATGGCMVGPAEPPSGSDVAADEPDDETGSGSGDSQSSISPTGYLERIAHIHCQQAFGCRSNYPDGEMVFESTWGTTVPACTAQLLGAWDPAAIETEIAKGRIMFDGTAAIACLGAVAFGTCDEHWERGIQWAEPCYHVLVGTVVTGETCISDYACASRTCDLAERRCL